MGWVDVTLILISFIAFVCILTSFVKHVNIKLSLFGSSIGILMTAALFGKLNTPKSTGIAILDPFMIAADSFVTYISGPGIAIMLLFGYSNYMSQIRANDAMLNIIMRPLKVVRGQYFLLICAWFVGNLLSVVVPSASSLAMVLMPTLFIVLKR